MRPAGGRGGPESPTVPLPVRRSVAPLSFHVARPRPQAARAGCWWAVARSIRRTGGSWGYGTRGCIRQGVETGGPCCVAGWLRTGGSPRRLALRRVEWIMHGLCSESSGLILELCGHRGSADFFVLGLWHAFFLVPEGELACRRAQQDRRIGNPANPHRLCPRAISFLSCQ